MNLNSLKEFAISISSHISLSKDLQIPYGNLSQKEIKKLDDNEYSSLFFENTWVSGGQSGGNCWAEGPQEYSPVSAETPGNLNEPLLSIIKEFCPNMTAIFFFENITPLVKYYNFTESEYYGNYYEYTRVYVMVEELFDVLKSYEN